MLLTPHLVIKPEHKRTFNSHLTNDTTYRLINPLGSGGFGETWKAQDQTGNMYAIKFIRLYGNLSDTVEHITINTDREIYILQKLQSMCPYINCYIESFSVGSPDTTIYLVLVTHLIVGKPLTQYIGSMTDDQLFRLAFRMLDTLNELHSRGVIHRDIKPDNIMIDCNSKPIFIDFGISCIQGRECLPGGTIAFLAPESFLYIDWSDIARQVGLDLYALGITLYQVKFGNLPFLHTYSTGQYIAEVAGNELSQKLMSSNNMLEKMIGVLVSKDPLVRQQYREIVGYIIDQDPNIRAFVQQEQKQKRFANLTFVREPTTTTCHIDQEDPIIEIEKEAKTVANIIDIDQYIMDYIN